VNGDNLKFLIFVQKIMTLVFVVVTSIISVFCFSNRAWLEKLQFNPYRVYHKKEYYRLITHGFVHADWVHLIINMLVLYSFGSALELYLGELRNSEILNYSPAVYYVILYFSALVISSLTTLKKYKDEYHYNAVGASGAVSTVLFACIFFNPWHKLLFWAIIPVPGILFGVLYLWYSQYMGKRNNDNINHDAHFLGALYGLTFPILLEPRLFYGFIQQLIHFNL
jgi:membrane associated rhomboid family serine protease